MQYRSGFLAPAIAMALSIYSIPAAAQPSSPDTQTSLFEKSIEELMNIEVSSAGRKPQKLVDAATAITVITQEDIRRSGMNSIPELLRLAPGLQVAQIDGSTWAIGSRGFNDRYSNKLLVLLDGRTVYTPTFSGVYWDALDVTLEDIDRIEVIRGPGGTLWGSNAVNGVINITTKSSAATQGGHVNAGLGNYERQGSVRYGGKIGDAGHYRIYGKNAGNDNFQLASGAQANDKRNISSAGFSADWDIADGHSVTAQGDSYDGNSYHGSTYALLNPPSVVPVNLDTALRGSNLLLNWKRVLSSTSDWRLKFYYDTYQRRDVLSGEQLDTYDLDFQQRLLGESHDVVWGGGWRRTRNITDSLFMVSYNPPNQTDKIINVFVQDEISLVQERLHLIVGSKFEHNQHTGLEPQPNLRLLWKMDERQSAWAAISHAVHTPSRSERDIAINFAAFTMPSPPFFLPPPAPQTTVLMRILGNPALHSERVTAYEAGYRVRPSEQLSLEANAFYNEYTHLVTADPGTPFFEAGRMVMPLQLQNNGRGATHGIELTGSWHPAERWELKAGYSWLKMNLHRDPGSLDTTLAPRNGQSPRQQLQLLAHHALDSQNDLSAALYYVDRLPATNQNIPAYTRLDLRYGWHPQSNLEISLGARNLLDRRHPEFVATEGPSTSQVPRSIYGQATWRF